MTDPFDPIHFWCTKNGTN